MNIVALVSAFNEADVIGPVVGDLIDQDIGVYVLDDGSTDGTVAAVEPLVGRGVIAIERIAPPDGTSTDFNWERILNRKAELARELDADWFIHHDADEFRESPWPHLTLGDAIRRVDAMGYNAIDFASLNFWPVHDRFEPGSDVRDAFPYYSERAPFDRLQIRCWKKALDVDLASTGGHEARFAGRNVFPIRFILRHYPIRGQSHGARKVFAERRARFRAEERTRGWHIQYDEFPAGTNFVRAESDLQKYDRDAVSVALTLRHRGVEELEAALDATRQELESRQLDLAAHRRELDLRRQELDRVAGALAGAHTQSAALRQQIDAHEALHAQARGHIEAQHREVERQRGELESRAAELAARSAEIDVLEQVIQQRDVEIRNWKRSHDDAVRRLQAFEESRSWRWTAPLRAVFRLFAKRPGQS